MDDPDTCFSGPWPPTEEHLRALIDDVCTDAYGDSEQVVALATAFEDHGELPVPATVHGEAIRFEAVEDRDTTLLARVRPPTGRRRSVPLEDVRPPDRTPAAFLVAAFRTWRGLGPSDAPPEEGAEEGSDLERVLQEAPRATLEALLVELCATSEADRRRVHEVLGLGYPSGDPGRLAMVRERIGRWVAPGPDDSFALEGAIDAVDHYVAETRDAAGEAALLVHFLASGVAATRAYGDLFSSFYQSMSDVATRCGDALEDDEELARRFLPELRRLCMDVDPQLEEPLAELVCRLEAAEDDES